MKAVLLDKATIGNDVSLQEIENQCKLISYNTTDAKEVLQRISDADIIITNKVVIGKEEMDIAGNLKLICVAATGYNNIDIEEAKKRNIVVANVKGYSTESVAQTIFGFIFTIMNSIIAVSNDIKKGLWQQSPVFTMLNHPFIELKGKKLGIIGYGSIGKRVAEIGKVMGMDILISESLESQKKDPTRLSFNDLLQQSDIITIHTPLTDKTKDLITAKELKLMKNSAILINAARGGIINEQNLYEALVNKEIRYTATDVLTQEPPKDDNILFKAPNIMITPHIAWTSFEARQKLVEGISNNIKLFTAGKSNEINLCKFV
ncbi:MAG: D-2-hydroxyacid dehydrogenase [Bacteroidales bacterium]|nr:D-2-hydroxyacid dehydrogenase [Bacteroidales bacterium]